MSDIHTLSGAYALDALTDLERAAFARHLEQCPACAQEVAEFAETAARLAGAAATPPPAELRGRVLAEVGRTRQLGPRRTQAPPATGRWRRRTAAVAAAVVLLAVGIGALAQEQRVRDAQRQSAQAARIQAVLTAPDAVVRTTAGPDGTGRVTLVVSDSMDEAVAVLGGLPTPGTDRIWQLWMLDGRDQATDKGRLGTGATGGAVLVEGVRGEKAFAITKEPAGGSKAPTPPTESVISLT